LHNEKLIEHLQSSREMLEHSSRRENSEDAKGMSYLYFSPIQERLSFHAAEKYLNHNSNNPFAISLTQKNQNDLLDFRPYFDAALIEKKISLISAFPIPYIENCSKGLQESFINELVIIEKTRGILNALLNLRNWAFFPNKTNGSKNRKRIAEQYLKMVLGRLNGFFDKDKDMKHFLKWCGKRTRKILNWGFKQKELLAPHISTLPIYKAEAAVYGKYFLQMTCISEGQLKQHFIEMTIYLSLCFAFARKYSRQVSPNEILEVTKNSISKTPQVISSKPVKDIREKSKGEHEALQLVISEDFLEDGELWPSVLTDSEESNYLNTYCRIARINGRTAPISKRLADAIELMGEFSLTVKDVENRIQEAFKVVGLSQSSGGISPKCFLNQYHYWEGEDVRKHLEPKKIIIGCNT
jgi:hypothetical protein